MTRKGKIIAASMTLALAAVLAAGVAFAGKGGKPNPPCGCPQTITLPNGTVCTLAACGSDCVYVCPLP